MNRIVHLRRWFSLAGLVIFAIACGASALPTATPTPEPALPATHAEAVMQYLQNVNYQSGWELWPGLGEKYEGPPPHGMLLTTYLNDDAFNALAGEAGSFPNGSIIVKENYTPDGVLDATTVMYKVAGYNPEHNDWFWAKVLADGTVEAEGQVEGCQACHSQEQNNDYIMTEPIN